MHVAWTHGAQLPGADDAALGGTSHAARASSPRPHRGSARTVQAAVVAVLLVAALATGGAHAQGTDPADAAPAPDAGPDAASDAQPPAPDDDEATAAPGTPADATHDAPAAAAGDAVPPPAPADDAPAEREAAEREAAEREAAEREAAEREDDAPAEREDDASAAPRPLPVPSTLADCKALVTEGARSDARACLAALDEPRARAMVQLLDAWTPTPAPVVRDELSLSGLVTSGTAEAVLHGSVAGGGAGFLAAAALFSATRASEQDTLPWLIAAPAVGAVAGAAGTWVLVRATAPTGGDVAFTASTMWMGVAEGFALQLAVFDGDPDVTAPPLRFLTVLGGGLVGLGTGAVLAPGLDVTQGDAAVANSAALWGTVLTGFGLGTAAAAGVSLTLPQATLALAGGALLPYVAVLVAHPALTIERWPSWLIEAGGAGGLLVSSAAVVVLGVGGLSGPASVAFVGFGTAAGLALGVTAAALASDSMRESTLASAPPNVSVAPTILLDEQHRAVSGVSLSGSF